MAQGEEAAKAEDDHEGHEERDDPSILIFETDMNAKGGPPTELEVVLWSCGRKLLALIDAIG